MPNGNSLATKQLATGKLTWMLATIRMSGTSTYWALPEPTEFGAKTSIRLEKSRCNRFNASTVDGAVVSRSVESTSHRIEVVLLLEEMIISHLAQMILLSLRFS